MLPKWLLSGLLLALLATALSQRPRAKSRFRLRTRANPFDLTQPQVAESVKSETAVVNVVNKRRKSGSGTFRRRSGAAGGRRRAQRRRSGGGGASRNKIKRPGNLKPNKNDKDASNDVVPVTPSNDGHKVVCYYTNWSQYRTKIGKFMPEDIDPHLCTHIIYAFAWLKKGRLSSFEENDESKGGKIGFYERITGLKKFNKKLKVLIALGGWTFGTKRFRNIAESRYARQRFIFSAIPFLRKHNFDGLDLDWEYPAGKKDKESLNHLVKELYESFAAESEETGKPRLLLTAAVAVGPDKVNTGYDIPYISKYLDFINVMAYDFHGKWEKTVGHNAPLYAPSTDSEWRKQLSVSYAANLWNRLGAPKEKLVIGMPTYGRSFILANTRHNIVNSPATAGGEAGTYTGEEGFLSYYEICEMLHDGGIYVWDNEMKVPYMVKDDLWVGFDDEKAIRNKMKWLKDNGFGGAMVWTIDMDDFKGTTCGNKVKYPLISIMSEELMGKTRAGRDVDWSKITKVTVAAPPTLSPPEVVDPKSTDAIKAYLAQQKKLNGDNDIILPSTPRDAPKVLCYYTSWSQKRPGAGRFEPESVDPYLCTHVVYAFAIIKDGRLTEGQRTDIKDGFRNGTYQRLISLKQKNPSLKVMTALGGWAVGSEPFRELVSNQFRMNGFVYDAVEFLRLHKLDGLDISWEYPKGPDDKANYVNLLKELRIAFEGEAKSTGHPRLLLSAAVPASFEAMFAGYDVPEISQYLDFINIMTYDFHGQWESKVGHNSPLNSLHVTSSYDKKMTTSFSVKSWIKEGAPPQKIMLGMPAYGRSFKLASSKSFDIGAATVEGAMQGRYTQETGFLAYYEVCDFLYEDNTTLVWDNEQHVPFAYNNLDWVGFDDERSFEGKVEWLKEMNLGGVMIWSADMDDFRGNCGGGKYPLISTIISTFGNYTVPQTYEGPYENTGTLDGKFKNRKPGEVVCDDEDGRVSYHEDVMDCRKYYMCEGDRKHHMPCPVNLVFNVEGTACDWPENVKDCDLANPTKKKPK